MSAAAPLVDLRARREQLEGEVQALQGQLARATRLLESLRASGPEPQGFVVGLFGGLGLIVVAFVGFLLYVVEAAPRVGAAGGPWP